MSRGLLCLDSVHLWDCVHDSGGALLHEHVLLRDEPPHHQQAQPRTRPCQRGRGCSTGRRHGYTHYCKNHISNFPRALTENPLTFGHS